jgi:hypothetical protein
MSILTWYREGGGTGPQGVKQVHLGAHSYAPVATKAGVAFTAVTKGAPGVAEISLPATAGATTPTWIQAGGKVQVPVLVIARGENNHVGVPALPGPAQFDAVTLENGDRIEVLKIAGSPAPNNKREHEFTLAGGAKVRTLVLVTQAQAAPQKTPAK